MAMRFIWLRRRPPDGQARQPLRHAFEAASKPWWNRTLAAVNDAVVRLGMLDGVVVLMVEEASVVQTAS
jgi:hypothetical protein